MELPIWSEHRRRTCRECPHASRRDVAGAAVVTMADRCLRSEYGALTMRRVLSDPDVPCPARKFGRGVVDGRGGEPATTADGRLIWRAIPNRWWPGHNIRLTPAMRQRVMVERRWKARMAAERHGSAAVSVSPPPPRRTVGPAEGATHHYRRDCGPPCDGLSVEIVK